jgi:hypothetical protein
MKRGQIAFVIPLITLVIFLLIGLALAPTIANQTQMLQNTSGGQGTNLTAPGVSLIGLTPLLYAIVLVVTILGALAMFGR